jgi:peroxiredoxin Q/BCP
MNSRLLYFLLVLLAGGMASRAAEVSPAPAFSLPSTSGRKISLADFRKRWLVLVFFPKAGAVRDVQQMKSLKDAWPECRARGAEILAVSMDPLAVLQKFKQDLDLPFELASDEQRRASEAYGAMGIGGLFSARKTFLIDPEGRLVRTLDRVREKEHGRQVLQVLEEAQTAYSAR